MSLPGHCFSRSSPTETELYRGTVEVIQGKKQRLSASPSAHQQARRETPLSSLRSGVLPSMTTARFVLPLVNELALHIVSPGWSPAQMEGMTICRARLESSNAKDEYSREGTLKRPVSSQQVEAVRSLDDYAASNFSSRAKPDI